MKYFSRINAIANRLERLAPSHRDPFRFHEEKSELVHELRRIADESAGLRAANDNRPSVGRPGLLSQASGNVSAAYTP